MYLRLFLFLSLILYAQSSDPSCKTGILSGRSCCPSICGLCGGPKCGLRTRQTKTACCSSAIQASTRNCRTASPPCKITTPKRGARANAPDPGCAKGVAAKGACCPAECSVCGGQGCRKRGRLIGSDCCVGRIRRSGRRCVNVSAPCVMKEPMRRGAMTAAMQENSLVDSGKAPVEAQDKYAVTKIMPRASLCETKVRRVVGCFCYIVLKRVVDIRNRVLFVEHCVDTFGKKEIFDMSGKCDHLVRGPTAEVNISNLVHEMNLLIPKCYPPMTPLVAFKPVPFVYSR